MAPGRLRLLSFDGGGVRTLSSLFILRNLMDKLNDAEDAAAAAEPLKPCDVFDMIGGTGTGGVVAVMLGRLKMSADECISAFKDLTGHVFATEDRKSCPYELRLRGGGSHVHLKPRYDSKKLETLIKRMIRDAGLDEEALLRNPDANECKVFVCTANRHHNAVTFRSYRSPHLNDLLGRVKIWEACRATCAAHGYFDALPIEDETFTDGGILNNNPTGVLCNEAADVWANCPTPQQALQLQLACVVSIGTGVPQFEDRGTAELKELVSALKDLAMDTEREAERFATTDIGRDPRYFRFNVQHGLDGIAPDESQHSAAISSATRSYCQQRDVIDKLRACAWMLAGKPDATGTARGMLEGVTAAAGEGAGPQPSITWSHLLKRLDVESVVTEGMPFDGGQTRHVVEIVSAEAESGIAHSGTVRRGGESSRAG